MGSCSHNHQSDHHPKKDEDKLPKTWPVRAFATLVLIVAPLSHGGISFLGMMVLLGALSATLLTVGVTSAFFPFIAVAIGLVCAIETWGLDVQAVRRELRERESDTIKAWEIYAHNVKQARVLGAWATFVAIMPKWRRFIPDLIFILYYRLFGWAKSKKVDEWDDKDKEWFAALRRKPIIEALFAPIMFLLGPVAEGSESFMGFVPILFFFGIATTAFGGLSVVGIVICSLAFFVSAVENFSLEGRATEKKLHAGFSGIGRALARIASSTAELEYEKPLVIKNLRVITQEDYDQSSEPQRYRRVYDRYAQPLFDEDGQGLYVDFSTLDKEHDFEYAFFKDEDGETVHYKDGVKFLSEADSQIKIKIGNLELNLDPYEKIFVNELQKVYRNHKQPYLISSKSENLSVYIDGEKQAISLKKGETLFLDEEGRLCHGTDGREVKSETGNTVKIVVDKRAPKTITPLEPPLKDKDKNKKIVVPPYPVRQKGFFERWLPLSLGMFMAVMGPLVWAGTIYLGMMTTLTAFAAGPWIPIVSGVIAFIAAIQNVSLDVDYTMQMIKGMGKGVDNYFANIGEQEGVRAKAGAFFPSWKRFVPDALLKGLGYKLKTKRDRWHRLRGADEYKEKSWRRVLIGPFIKLLGPLAHGADAFRSSRPVFLGIFLILGLTGTITLSPLLTGFMAVAFCVSYLECMALEVKETLKQLDKDDNEPTKQAELEHDHHDHSSCLFKDDTNLVQFRGKHHSHSRPIKSILGARLDTQPYKTSPRRKSVHWSADTVLPEPRSQSPAVN